VGAILIKFPGDRTFDHLGKVTFIQFYFAKGVKFYMVPLGCSSSVQPLYYPY